MLLEFPATAWAGEIVAPIEGHAANPTWSADGRYVAFEVHDAQSRSSIYVADPDRESVELVSHDAEDPTWHPGGLLVFVHEDRLFLAMPPSHAAQLFPRTLVAGPIEAPAVSPDGNVLAFITDHGELWSWNRTTNAIVHHTSTRELESDPTFSPDGTSIAVTRGPYAADIVLVSLRGAAERVRAHGPGDQIRPAFVDATRLVYFEELDDSWSVATTGSGDSPTTVSEGVRLPTRSAPPLTPDHEWVAWTSADSSADSAIYLTRIDGSETLALKTAFGSIRDLALTQRNGRILVAYTHQTAAESWRRVRVDDITPWMNASAEVVTTVLGADALPIAPRRVDGSHGTTSASARPSRVAASEAGELTPPARRVRAPAVESSRPSGPGVLWGCRWIDVDARRTSEAATLHPRWWLLVGLVLGVVSTLLWRRRAPPGK